MAIVRRTTAALCALGVLAVAAPAGAQDQYPPSGTCSLAVTAAVVPAGGQTTVFTTNCTSGYAPGSTVGLQLNPPLGTTIADADQQIRQLVTIPDGTSAGPHTITSTGPGAAGGTLVLHADIVVTVAGAAGPSGAALATTGTDVLNVLLVALATLTVGFALFVSARRRARVRTASER